ncbi:SpoIIE family protein phosphatase [Streptomyces rochei]|uniref:SpoIIE family protein phosphatase n=2 Tax=Streptomyces rochei group TaxID=2867164 RepID=A0ABY6BZJ3_9ACTN|nr:MULTISPECIES: SpoIIE family protein phosphatase [Streptomyces]MBQ0879488.1 SpoIIE family protein phosphatase [Streptomyces sp. RT42]MBQ0912996.1 SpoIIE family protein phosphatase [Streptomyces sp. RM99]MCC8450953.1 SpoIIE family protein phosphatase [Streptomyces rochei]MDI3098717.1 SpoIIE family protein phosphatase [Streptomyces sp. AN-3]NUV96641.1 SpoIIE family protein phosphatase [Streptomyces sp. KAI 90]
MTTGLIPGEQPPDPGPTGGLPQQRGEPVGHEAVHGERGSRSSVITARAAASFEPVGRSVASARSFVRDTLQGWGHADIVDDAVVLTSELVTNAVVHAGTTADVVCLRSDDGVRIEVADHYPEREVPLQGSPASMGSLDREGGRGLQLCAALADRWGVEYTPTLKNVWFHLHLPERPVGTRAAGPSLPADLLPLADGRVRVAVVQIDRTGAVTSWNEDAGELFGYTAEQVVGKPLTDLAAWPHTPGTSTGIAEALRLSRWEGSYGIRDANGRVTPVYASHLRVRDAGGEPSTVCLLVRDHERAVLQTPLRVPSSDGGASSEGQSADPFEVFIGSPAPDDLDGLLQRTVERARDMLDADAAFLLLATDDETELEVRASTGLPSARQRFARVPVEAGPGRYGSARMPAVHDDLAAVPGAVPLLNGTGMRSVVTVPLKVEGRLTGSLGVAAEAAGRYSNEEALRLQFAADRIALAVESARLGELERLRRGSLSFLVEASDLLAGTLDRDQTLALMAQMTVPTLATWCAVYTIADQASEPYLSYVLHEDEELIDGIKSLLSKIAPPDPVPTPGARVWSAPGELAHQAALRTSMRDLGLNSGTTPQLNTGIGPTLATAAAVGGETVVLPLVARNRVIGMLTLGKPTDEHFRQEILELAEDLSRRAALALDNARLYSERTAISQSLQRSLLPPELPVIDGVEVEVIYRAAGEGNEVGGDFYDLFPISDDAYGFAIGDVCGTGPNAAAVTGLARHALRLLAREGLSGPAVLERLNSAILDEGARSRFLTLLYGEMRPQEDGSAELKVVCAGHPLPLRLRQDGTVEPAAEPQPLLGVIEDLELYEQTVTLDPGDVLLCVTDGVTERREGTRMLGDDGLADVLTTCTGLTAGAVAARIMRAVERFASDAPSDDMAILAMRVPEPHAD